MANQQQHQLTVEEREWAFQHRLQSFAIVNNHYWDLAAFLRAAYPHFTQRLAASLRQHCSIKVSASLVANFEKITHHEGGSTRTIQKLYMHTKVKQADLGTNLIIWYDDHITAPLISRIDDANLQSSGLTLHEILELNIKVALFDPLHGSSYMPLPSFLKYKGAIVNVKNFDNQCFKYAVLSALHPQSTHADRASKYLQYQNNYDFACLNYPVDVHQISAFEFANPRISINVYMLSEANKKVQVLRLAKDIKQHHIHLLLLTKVENSHWCWIKNLSALATRQITVHKSKLVFCDRCLNHFYSAEKLRQHSEYCANMNECQIVMPSAANNIINFKNVKKQMMVPFVVYADIECILKPANAETDNMPKGLQTDKTNVYQQHEACSVGYYFHCGYDDGQSYYKANRSPACVEWFAREMHQLAIKVDEVMSHPQSMIVGKLEKALYAAAKECQICNVEFGDDGDIKVRDHCHLTGRFRGAAHQSCNLVYRQARHIPVVFHNLSNYDAHFIIESLADIIPGSISVIPCTDQKYISFSLDVPVHEGGENGDKRNIQLRFIDSFRFMAESLDALAKSLDDNNSILKAQLTGHTEQQMMLLNRKGVFPYDYMDSWAKFEETALPPKEAFYSKLVESDITDEEYGHAQNVWQMFNIKTLGEYSDLYMKTDVLLLADIFENFRSTCYATYSLDPAHYYTAPGLSWDAMIKFTGVNIELLTDVDKLMFVERGIRGGISQCSKRHASANNMYTENFSIAEAHKFILYLDANNLYGYAMMQSLPLGNYRWCNAAHICANDILSIPEDGDTGCIFEVDLEYPVALHDEHKDYPFCAENRVVPHTSNEKKLLLTLNDKKNYIIHYKMLQLALRNGLVLKKVHRALQFSQSAWMKPYIELNTARRMATNSKFEKDFFKLMVNAIYGKTMENVRNRVDIKLKKGWEGRHGAGRLVAMPNYKTFTVLGENLVAIEMSKTQVVMDKPIAVGMAILELSKVVMYDFYYGHLKPQYGHNVTMLYTDTDSFILEVETPDFYADMKRHASQFYDTSDYPEGNRYGIEQANKKVPGLFKDELCGRIVLEFVGLRAKMYAIRTALVDAAGQPLTKDEKPVTKKAKGVKKYVLAKKITFQHYLECLSDRSKVLEEAQNMIRAKEHQVYTITQNKVVLSPADNKRYILQDGVNTLPWGHYALPNAYDSSSSKI